MPNSDDYKRGYSKGYVAGCHRADKAIARARELEADAIARANRAEAGQGLGRCEDCAHWVREPQTAWGHCKPPESRYDAEHGLAIWFGNTTAWGERIPIATSAGFGCVLFRARTAPATEAA